MERPVTNDASLGHLVQKSGKDDSALAVPPPEVEMPVSEVKMRGSSGTHLVARSGAIADS